MKKRTKKLLSLRALTLPQRARQYAKVFASFFKKKAFLHSLASTWACAALAAPCGTAIIPNGIGIGEPASPTSLNPLLGPTLTNLQSAMLLFRPLVWVGRDATMDADRSLAASVQALDGNTRFRVTLKPWRWSDTTPVTSDDVVYYWERIQILGGLYAYAGQGGIPDQVQAVRPAGQGAIDFVLKAAVNPAWFTLNGLSTIYALPRHAWGNLGRDEMLRRQNDPTLARVVDGPFKLEKFRDDRYAVYTPNPLYGGHPSRLARLVVTFLEGDNPLHAVQAGEADIARVPYALWDRVRQTPGYDFTVLPEPYGYAAIMPNLRRPAVAFLQDVRVRRALAKAVDQAAMIRLLYRGLAAENHVPIPAGATAWRSPQSRAGNPDLAYDPAAAAALLAQAGWAAGADGVLTHAGARMEFTILSAALSDDATEMQLLQVLQHSLKRLGIVMSIHRVSLDQFFEILGGPAGGWDAAIVANTNNAVPDGSGFFDTGGANNFGGYTNPHMDDLIHTSISGVGNQALFAYQDYAAAQLPWIVVPQGRFPVMVRRRLRGVEEMSNPLGFWSPEYLWVDDRNGQTGEGREQCDLVAGEAMR